MIIGKPRFFQITLAYGKPFAIAVEAIPLTVSVPADSISRRQSNLGLHPLCAGRGSAERRSASRENLTNGAASVSDGYQTA